MKRCDKCGSANTLAITFRSNNGVFAIPLAQKKKIFPKYSNIIATACSDCGAIFDLKLDDPQIMKPFAGYDA